MNIKSYLLLTGVLTLTSACVPTGPTITSIGNDEAFSYIDNYMAEYEALNKANTDNNKIVKWIQPDNKTEPCKTFVGTSKDNDRTLDESYSIYWDGECKYGYAYGLGREFEKTSLTNLESIVTYKGKNEMPDYYIYSDNLNGITIEGNPFKGYYVKRQIIDEPLNFNITYNYLFVDPTESKPVLSTTISPFSPTKRFHKVYQNFRYTYTDESRNEFSSLKSVFETYHRDKENGFAYLSYKKYAPHNGAEMINGSMVRFVNLPPEFLTHSNAVLSDIIDANQKANTARQQALRVKKSYTNKICKDSVTVDFMDNDEYKAICDETEFYADLKEKINAKLAEIEKQNQIKRDQLYQKERMNAQRRAASAAEAQARAAQRQANATEQPATYNYNNNNQQLLNSLINAPQVPIYSGSSGGSSMQLCNQAGILVQCR